MPQGVFWRGGCSRWCVARGGGGGAADDAYLYDTGDLCLCGQALCRLWQRLAGVVKVALRLWGVGGGGTARVQLHVLQDQQGHWRVHACLSCRRSPSLRACFTLMLGLTRHCCSTWRVCHSRSRISPSTTLHSEAPGQLTMLGINAMWTRLRNKL